MNLKRYLGKVAVALALAVVFPAAGSAAEPKTGVEITASGVIRPQGITTYMYGTHVLSDETAQKSYALTSSCVDLNQYLGQRVTVKGRLVPGYPVEGGPDYLDVQSVLRASGK